MRPDRLILILGKAFALCDMVLDAGEGIFTDVADMDIIESPKCKAVSVSPFII